MDGWNNLISVSLRICIRFLRDGSPFSAALISARLSRFVLLIGHGETARVELCVHFAEHFGDVERERVHGGIPMHLFDAAQLSNDDGEYAFAMVGRQSADEVVVPEKECALGDLKMLIANTARQPSEHDIDELVGPGVGTAKLRGGSDLQNLLHLIQ